MFSAGICLACQRKSEPEVSAKLTFDTPVAKPIHPLVSEVSGIADSKINPGFLWAQEDNGNPPNLILLSHEGNVVKKIPIKNATNNDWEDMALVGDQLYIADIGDNKLDRNEYMIYQFKEPSSSVNAIDNYKKIRFKYPDGCHDAEAWRVDPAKKDIYIITKRDVPSKIYKLSYPQSFNAVNTAIAVGSLPYTGVVSAAISYDAKYIMIKTYLGLRVYQSKEPVDIPATLATTFTDLYYHIEPQGEAVTFAADNSGFYTLSEKGLSNAVNLYFYRKK